MHKNIKYSPLKKQQQTNKKQTKNKGKQTINKQQNIESASVYLL